MTALEDMVLVPIKELRELRDMKKAYAAEQRKHAKARMRIAELRLMLTNCALQFREYEQQHRAKTPPQLDKARTNARYAEMIEELLK